MVRRMSEYLEVDDSSGKEMIRCSKCQHVFCPLTENYKNYALMSNNPLSKAGPEYYYRPSDRFVLREYYCPECVVMLDVEMVSKEVDAPIWNIQLKPKG